MVRVRTAPASRERRRRILKRAKGYRTSRGSLIRLATEAVERGLAYAYRDRKVRKRDFRALWITRIGAACKAEGISYSRFMDGLKKAHVALDRKVLADLAAREAPVFKELVRVAQGT
ncbi:MAG: 50S ribosomal protein L20 [Candidatus Aureabacteria bacterium]|nr:50S ribosomal protein L20 [Candidatus Auribacterota bacterium]